MRELHQKKIKLEALVDDFQSNNEEFIKIIKAVEEKVLSVLPNAKMLLKNALLSITESIRPSQCVDFGINPNPDGVLSSTFLALTI
jgi:division protein CdvB (Snf7/Vps24/ESCRT-III family)